MEGEWEVWAWVDYDTDKSDPEYTQEADWHGHKCERLEKVAIGLIGAW